MSLYPYVDVSALIRLKELGGESFLIKMIQLFEENSENKVFNALQSWENHDFHTLERSVHSLVSSAGNLGATPLMELAIKIERQASKKDPTDIPLLLEELQSIYNETTLVLQEYKEGLPI